jgi:hypothetical protein
MTKKEKFVLLVQTAAIVCDIRYQRSIAITVVANALEVQEERIPKDTELAALEYIQYRYGLEEMPKPKWLS